MSVEATARVVLDAKLDPGSKAPIAVAVSGGGDSMALMHLVADWARAHGRELHVLIVDHGVHADSPLWARFVAGAAAGLGLPCRVLRWREARNGAGLPVRAREARHRLLAEAARDIGARVILLGHTRDDHWENQLIRLDGTPMGWLWAWAPSPAWPEGRGVFLLRPLLSVPRAELRSWLDAAGVRWLDDPANADAAFARARARAKLNAEKPRGWDDEVHWTVFDRRRGPALDWTREEPDGRIVTHRPASSAEASGRVVVRPALSCASGLGGFVRRASVEHLMRRLGDPLAGPIVATLGGARIVADRREAAFGRELGRRPAEEQIVKRGQEVVWDGRFAIQADEAGLVCAAAGLRSRLSKAERERLADSPPWVRATLPVLRTPGGAVHLPPWRSLTGERLRASLGAYASERDLA